MKTITLIGHSGCKLEVKEVGGNLAVIKTAKDNAYNPRLERQWRKQQDFTHSAFRAPRVLESGHTPEGLFAFSMEYINGFTLAEHLKYVPAAELPSIAELFLTLVPPFSGFDLAAKAAYRAKLADLRHTIVTRTKSVLEALRRLESYPWEHSIQSYCHGDLTLENVIWKEGDAYLIDFLDSFYDSWMQDFGKLVFDLETLWSYRGSTADENLLTRISIFKSLLLEKLYALPHGKNVVREIYHIALLHALRILPYTHDKETTKFLIKSVNKLQEAIDSL